MKLRTLLLDKITNWMLVKMLSFNEHSGVLNHREKRAGFRKCMHPFRIVLNRFDCRTKMWKIGPVGRHFVFWTCQLSIFPSWNADDLFCLFGNFFPELPSRFPFLKYRWPFLLIRQFFSPELPNQISLSEIQMALFGSYVTFPEPPWAFSRA